MACIAIHVVRMGMKSLKLPLNFSQSTLTRVTRGENVHGESWDIFVAFRFTSIKCDDT